MTKQPDPMNDLDEYYRFQGKMLSCRLPQEDYMYVAPGQYNVTFNPELKQFLEANNDTRGINGVNDSATDPGISQSI